MAGIESSAKSRSVAAERQDDKKHRRHQPLAVFLDPEFEAVPLVAEAQMAAREPDDRVIPVVFVLGIADQVDGGVHQERAEDVEDPRELVDGHRAERDEDAAENQRQHNADQQRLLLVLPRHIEAGHDDEEDEEVIHRQAVLGEPAGDEFHPELAAVEVPDPRGEKHGQSDIDRQRDGALSHRRFVRPTSDDDDVEQQHGDRHAQRDDPLELGNVQKGLRSSNNAGGLFHRHDGP